jgi:hypothetical protein
LTHTTSASRLSTLLLAEAARCAAVGDTPRGLTARILNRHTRDCLSAFADEQTPPAQRRSDAVRWRVVSTAARIFLRSA